MNDFHDRVLGCLVGGLVGDAMGTPTENLEPSEIAERFGWVSSPEGGGTDDSAMRTLLCEALVATGGHAGPEDWAERWIAHADLFTGPLRSKFFVSVLQTAEKLVAGCDPRTVADGNMASSSSAMCIAPVGIVNAGNPRAAAAQAWAVASLIHQGRVAFCADAAASVAAGVAVAVVPGADVDDVLAAAVAALDGRGARVMRDLVSASLDLARREPTYEAFREAFHGRFRQSVACDSRETVPATFGLLALAGGDPLRAVESAANFGRDTDTIGAMIGSITGGLAGAAGLPVAWTASLDEAVLATQRRTTAELAAIAVSMAADARRVSTAALARIGAEQEPEAGARGGRAG